jgi:hypothetical protein
MPHSTKAIPLRLSKYNPENANAVPRNWAFSWNLVGTQRSDLQAGHAK